MNKYILPIIFILGNILHIGFLKLNEILKVADSFAYLQMSYHLKSFSLEGFGNGWFGFFYSLPIGIIDFFANNDIISAFIVNILLFNILIIICYLLGKNYLSDRYNILFIILLFLSPILLNYNINILSENIYIPLFLILFIGILNYKDIPYFGNNVFLRLILALLYLTRAEAFIYIGSIGIIIFYLFLSRKISFPRAIFNYLTIIISFFIFISPYLFYLHSLTGEWGLTNKGSSNLRQAELRGISKMDDDGFEQAVGELTPDNHHLIAGFAGGLKYDKPQENESLKEYILKDTKKVIDRVIENQVKLYSNNLPNIIIGNALSLYKIEGSDFFYKNKLFLAVLFIPLLILIYGIIALIKNGEKYFVLSFFSFFIVASLFFSIFFILDRYFVIFIPLFLFFIVYGLQNIIIDEYTFDNIKYVLFSLIFISIFGLGTFSYYNTIKLEDAKYEVKSIAGEGLKKYHFDTKDIKIMERFPIVTYYSGTKERWLTPYTPKLENLVEYARFNNIDYLVVDSLDFKKYRPNLLFLFEENNKKYKGLQKLEEFEKNGEKVIIYKIK